MQTTLLGLAVAIILALVTALIGPLLIDWGRYRASFEAEASRMAGTPVRVSGAIDARLLPTPSLLLRGIETGAPGAEPKLRARALRVEFALGPLVRGEWRADELRLEAPEVMLGLDAAGRIETPPLAIGVEPDQFSVERLVVEDARITFTDAASGAVARLDKVSFKGDLRSLQGPFKGEGAFVSAGQLYGYHFAAGRRGEDGAMKLRLAIDPSDRPLALETEGTLWLTRTAPRFEGAFTLSRPAGFALPGGKTLTSVPWRASGRIKGTPAAALIEQLEVQYGPEERAIKLAGTADLQLGARPRFAGVLSARQIDIDRSLPPTDGARRPPAATLQALADTLAETVRPPLPVKLGLSIDSLVFGGAPLQAVRGDVRIDGETLLLDDFEFRAPGLTQVRLSGELTAAARSLEFVGPVNVDSTDPRALVAWLEGRADTVRLTSASLRARGDVTIGSERIAVERLRAAFDRRPVEGRLAYVYATANRPARLDAALSADEFDVDGALAFAGNALAGAGFDRPGEITLALDVGKATYAGVEAKNAKAKLNFDGNGLHIERVSVADLNGAAINASGRIDTLSASPRGSIAMTIDAQRLEGAARLAGRFVPRAADAMQGLAGRAAKTRLNAKLDVGSPAGASTADAKTPARLHIDGALGPVRIDILADGHGDLRALSATDVNVTGRMESDDGAALARLIGLDRYAVVEGRPARIDFAANGAPGSALRIEGKFAGAGLDATAAGSLRLAGDKTNAAFDLALAAADMRLPRGPSGLAVPVNLRARLGVDGERVTFEDIRGRIAGSALVGRLGLVLGHPLRVDGRIDADDIDAGAVIGLGIGMPAAAAPRASGWVAEPFAALALADVVGRIEFSAARAVFTPMLSGEQIRGAVVIEPAAVSLERIEGRLGGGLLTGQASARGGAAGLSLHGQFALNDADLAQLLPKKIRSQASGRVTLQVEAGGTGRSPAALIGDLAGSGTMTLEGLQASGLDPSAINAAVRAGEQGVLIDAVRIGDIVRAALDRGHLNVPWAGGAFTLSGGQLNLGPMTAPARDANIAASGSFDLSDEALDLRLTVAGAPRADALGGQRPEMQIVLKGPLDAARRSVDVTSLVNWLTMRSVEQEARRLDTVEREHKRLEALDREAKRLEAIESARRARAQEINDAAVGSVPSAERAPALPPPIDIRPAPGASDRRIRNSAPAPPLADNVPLAVPTFNSR